MKIQAINTNTNFKGLFTDKSSENKGEWLMEYSPYSWESDNTSTMESKKRIDIYSPKLPDNEEIYTHGPGRKASSRDILGTESYYVKEDGRMRRFITQKPALSREESLTVYDKKLGTFLDMKKYAQREMERNMYETHSKVEPFYGQYKIWANKLDEGVFGTSKSSIKENINEFVGKIVNSENSLYSKANEYTQFMTSLVKTHEIKERNRKEINILRELRKSGDLIDISRRNIEEPNGPLYNALNDVKALAKKYICLPDRFITAEEILHKINIKDISLEEVERVISELVKKKRYIAI